MDIKHHVLQWVESKGYEILAQKDMDDGRVSFIAKKNFVPGFVKKSKDEIKVLRLAGIIETRESFKNPEATNQMNRMVMWKTMNSSNEKWIVLFKPDDLGREEMDEVHYLILHSQRSDKKRLDYN